MNRRCLFLSAVLVLILPQLIYRLMPSQKSTGEVFSIDKIMKIEETITPEQTNMIRVKNGDKVQIMELETYVTGVVMGEMPAFFEEEALKAQAVASRTFTLRRVQQANKHQDADVCTNPACCQAFCSAENFTGTASDLDKITSAVEETRGQVLVFQGNLIEATYFSSSGGRTENAVAVWGTEIPYLQSVESPGEEISDNYEVTVFFSHSDFLNKLGIQDEVLNDEEIQLTYTDGGGVEYLHIGGRTYSGTQARMLLDLKSTVFTIDLVDDGVLITTSGYGHRVGMSQYGAEAMAIDRCTYHEILKHYYTDVELLTLTNKQIDSIFDKTKII